jgi:hypothetical protein
MDAAFEAVIWNEVDISMHTGNVMVPRGIYMVTMMHDERGSGPLRFIGKFF